MKTMLFALTTVLCAFIPITDHPIDRLGVKGPLEFNNIQFKLIWADRPNDTYYIQEYLPEGEKLEEFNQMMTIHLFDTNMKVKAAVGQKIQELTERQKTDPTCKYQVNESPDGEEVIIDFLLGESKDDVMTIVEFNVYRYKQIDISENRKGILVYAYSKRSYGNDITRFFSTLKGDRTDYLNQMIATELPAITIKEE